MNDAERILRRIFCVIFNAYILYIKLNSKVLKSRLSVIDADIFYIVWHKSGY